MFNVLYDFNGLSPWVVPYLGAGVGYQGISEKFSFTNRVRYSWHGDWCRPAPGRQRWRKPLASFAYQAIVGAAFPLPQVAPGLAATLEYRFMGTTGKPQLQRNSGGAYVSRQRLLLPAGHSPVRPDLQQHRCWSACATTSA